MEHTDEQNSLQPHNIPLAGACGPGFKSLEISNSSGKTFQIMKQVVLLSLVTFSHLFFSHLYQIILHSQNVWASFYKQSSYLSSYFNILCIMLLLIKSTHSTSAVFIPSLGECSFISKSVQSTGHSNQAFYDQVISAGKFETTSQNFITFSGLEQIYFYERAHFYLVVLIISSVLLTHC